MRVDSWPLHLTGLLYDRAWALVDAHGRAVTQKSYPKLALVQPAINLQEGVMLVSAPGCSDVLVILLDDKKKNGNISVCSDGKAVKRCVSSFVLCSNSRYQ